MTAWIEIERLQSQSQNGYGVGNYLVDVAQDDLFD